MSSIARSAAVAGWVLSFVACGARVSLGELGDEDTNDASPDAIGGGSPDAFVAIADATFLDEVSSSVDATLEDDATGVGDDSEGGAVLGDASPD